MAASVSVREMKQESEIKVKRRKKELKLKRKITVGHLECRKKESFESDS